MRLLFGRLRVGEISNPFFSDQTWYGDFLPAPSIGTDAVGQRILAYKTFCEGWNERVHANPDSPPDASEFDEYLDLTASAEWQILDEDGVTSHHVGCPVFFRGGDFSCRSWEFLRPDNG
jgi:hypothetical protein